MGKSSNLHGIEGEDADNVCALRNLKILTFGFCTPHASHRLNSLKEVA